MLQKNPDLFYYDIYPKVVPIGKEVEITIRALSSHVYFPQGTEVRIVPINAYPDSKGDLCSLSATETVLKFKYTFASEEEYQVRIFTNSSKAAATLSVYALQEDLLALKPLIGDFHSHSCISDGKEGPEFVAARYREEGFDFFTLTDHRRYESSRTAQNAFKDLGLDFKIYRGEEVHSPNNPIHIVNFASDEPINVEYLTEEAVNDKNCWREEYRPEWTERVKKIQENLTDLPEGVDPFIHSSCLLIAQLIREKGGMPILAHPHWKCSVRNVPDPCTLYWIKTGMADALELLGGQSVKENVTQLALYQELRSEGYKIPIVCSSDSHGTCSNIHCGEPLDSYHMFTEERTMVFAADNNRDDIIKAVKSLNSVALEQYEGNPCRIHGPYRLVQYALFLIHEYFPLQDFICREEGRLMREHISGNQEATELLKANAHRTTQMRAKYFYK